jgi:hypothetical protein
MVFHSAYGPPAAIVTVIGVGSTNAELRSTDGAKGRGGTAVRRDHTYAPALITQNASTAAITERRPGKRTLAAATLVRVSASVPAPPAANTLNTNYYTVRRLTGENFTLVCLDAAAASDPESAPGLPRTEYPL